MRLLLALIVCTLFSFSSYTQSKVYIIKAKGSGSGKCDVLLNGQKAAHLKTGMYLEASLLSAGPLTISIANPSGASNGMPKGLVLNLESGINYYVQLYTNPNYKFLLKKISKYEGSRVIFSSNSFSKQDFKREFKEDLNFPVIQEGLFVNRSSQKQKVRTSGYDDSSIALPEIEIITPIAKEGQIFKTESKSIIVKGKVSDVFNVSSVSVNGNIGDVNDGGYFSVETSLKYLENDITIIAFTKDGRFSKKQIPVYRAYSDLEVSVNGRMGKDYALLIASNQYDEHNNLINPQFDAKRIKEELEGLYSFQTQLLPDPTLQQVLIALKNYSKREFSEDDQLFIFIAGHGEYDSVFGEGYVVCKDSKKNDEARSSYLSHSNLRTIINNIQCKHIFLVMDVCFGGTFDPVIAHRGSSTYKKTDNVSFIKRKMKYKSRLYITSGGKEYVPDGRPGQHSPFAKNFIEALTSVGGEDNILTFNEIQRFIERTTPEPRVGHFGDNQPGSDFLFIAK